MICRSCKYEKAIPEQHLCERCKAILHIRRVATMRRNKQRKMPGVKGRPANG